MKVSLNWVKEFTKVELPLDQLVEKIGAQLGAVDSVTNLGKRYEGIVVAKVISCTKHNDAEKLSVCLIEDGGAIKEVQRDSNGHVQVVCGAPNVREGMLAAWIPPGAVVPSTVDKDPFIIEARQIRHEMSNGMLASGKELGIGDSHEGLLEITDAKPGDWFASVYKLDDVIIDIENKMFTHRPDLFGMLGIAREVAGINHQAFNSPDWYRADKEPAGATGGEGLALKVNNQMSDQVPRFMAIAMSGIQVKPSPVATQSYLARLGIKPINNIVDATNYVMLLTAQPLHAYDYDKLKNLAGGEARIDIRGSHEGEELTMLGGKTIKLKPGAVVIAAGEKAIGLGGVMGGAETEVDSSTKNIVLEVANFDMGTTRKTAMEYGLFTEAVTRFTKGQSLLQNPPVLAYALDMIQQLAGGEAASAVIDAKKPDLPIKNTAVAVKPDFVNQRLGLSLAAHEMASLLNNVELKSDQADNQLSVQPPFWRTDVHIPEDIVEEIGRLHGYDHLTLTLPTRTIMPAKPDAELSFKNRVRNLLASAGGNEVLTYSFVNEPLLSSAGQSAADAYHIKNALSPSLQYYRQSLAPSLLEKIHPNIKENFNQFALFEMGRTHVKGVMDDENLPQELKRLAVVLTKRSEKGAAYYAARVYSDYLLSRLGVAEVEYTSFGSELPNYWQVTAAAFEPKRSALVKAADHLVGIVGEPSANLRRQLKLPGFTGMLEFDLSTLQILAAPQKKYKPLNRFPESDQDICLRVKQDVPYAAVERLVRHQLNSAADEHGYNYSLEPVDVFQREADDHQQITWRIYLSHPERTLTREEFNKLLDSLAAVAAKELQAERI